MIPLVPFCGLKPLLGDAAVLPASSFGESIEDGVDEGSKGRMEDVL